jgi:hypothetical protein
MFNIKRFAAATVVAGTFAMGIPTATVEAQQNRQRGLVNVAVFEVIDDVTVVVEDVNVNVAVAANIAANVCGVTVPVAVLAEQVLGGSGEFTCTNEIGDSGVTIGPQ